MRPIILAAASVALMPAASAAAPANSAVISTISESVATAPLESARVLDPFVRDKDCPDTPMSLARKKAEKPTLRNLDELPPAEAFAAVDRRVENCPARMYLRETKGL